MIVGVRNLGDPNTCLLFRSGNNIISVLHLLLIFFHRCLSFPSFLARSFYTQRGSVLQDYRFSSPTLFHHGDGNSYSQEEEFQGVAAQCRRVRPSSSEGRRTSRYASSATPGFGNTICSGGKEETTATDDHQGPKNPYFKRCSFGSRTRRQSSDGHKRTSTTAFCFSGHSEKHLSRYVI